jgi:hypothetical protein
MKTQLVDNLQKNRRRLPCHVLVVLVFFGALPAMTIVVAQTEKPSVLTNKPTQSGKAESKVEKGEVDTTGVNDFDFFIGSWRVHHRRLKERLANNHQWVEFEGTSTAQKILGGLGNMDDNVLNLPGGTYRAVTIRTYDAAKRLWLIWWIDSRHLGSLDPPVVGRFENGVGTFYADDTFNGKPIRVRYLWTNRSDAPHWEQAFSEDGGKTWETNWTMDFTRIP